MACKTLEPSILMEERLFKSYVFLNVDFVNVLEHTALQT